MTRCEALKNPCAIRRGSPWKGLSTFQHDKEFCEFTDVVYGLRAFFVLMRTYHYKYKCNSIGKILCRFAPITENNTPWYIAFVVKYFREHNQEVNKDLEVPFSPLFDENFICNTWFNPSSPSLWVKVLCRAICKMESRYIPSDMDIERAISLL